MYCIICMICKLGESPDFITYKNISISLTTIVKALYLWLYYNIGITRSRRHGS